jgi:uncharacterized membrane protein
MACNPMRFMENNRDIRSRLIGANVPDWERIASILIGGGLAGLGIARRSLAGGLLAAIGGGLVVHGGSGRSGIYRMRAVRKGVEFRRNITIQCEPSDVYALWRDLSNLPRFMEHVKSIEVESPTVSKWIVQQGSKTFQWRAEITEDTPNRRLRWKSLPESDIAHEGTLDLFEAPGGRGTIVDVRMRYWPPGGLPVAGLLFEPLRRVPGIQLAEELTRLRMLIETGELATGARNPGELSPSEKTITALGV